MKDNEVKSQNQQAWDQHVANSVGWTVPVESDVIAKARNGEFNISLCWRESVPRQWFPHQLSGAKILCLACGGGQQAPVLSAAGADVTVMDLSAKQLEQDQMTASKEGLSLKTVQGDMCDLSCFNNESFDLVFCPVSITYIPDLNPLYSEVYRVLKNGGVFMLGAPNPAIYLFDEEKLEQEGVLQVVNRLPFNSLDELDAVHKQQFMADKRAIEFSHTLSSIIGGQLEAGFVIDRFFEESSTDTAAEFFKDYFATRAVKIKKRETQHA